ncbi:MAG TPA: hypothetical protein DCM05_10290 [Elusimicrobia bacterium]|nr:hypothetical protein [Elusimicrobiota bacterium]
MNAVFPVLLVGLILYYTVRTASGEPLYKRIFKFLGLLAAIIPLVGFIELAVFRETDHEYGLACGKVMGAALLWFGLNKLLIAFQ